MILRRDLFRTRAGIHHIGNRTYLHINYRWRNIAHYLPGSDIQKLKTKNEQITQDLRLVNVISSNRRIRQIEISNSQKTTQSLSQNSDSIPEERSLSQSQEEFHDSARKKVKLSDSSPPIRLLRPVSDSKLAEIVNIPTNPSTGDFPQTLQLDEGEEGDGEHAFRVKFIYEKEILDSSTKGEVTFTKNICWTSGCAELKLGRSDFAFLPEIILGKISREHATVLGYRNRRKESNLDEIMMVPTQKDTKSSQVYSQNATMSTAPINSSLLVNSPLKMTLDKEAGSSKTTHFAIYNESVNKTYVLTNHEYGQVEDSKQAIKGKFRTLKVGDKMELRHLDIVALKINPVSKAVSVGFQFLSENL